MFKKVMKVGFYGVIGLVNLMMVPSSISEVVANKDDKSIAVPWASLAITNLTVGVTNLYIAVKECLE